MEIFINASNILTLKIMYLKILDIVRKQTFLIIKELKLTMEISDKLVDT